jgi:uncharacterized repeat protein (TIGR03803 family)
MNYRGLRPSLCLSLLCLASLAAASAQTYNVLLNFDNTNGSSPDWLVQGPDGNLYGTTQMGGSENDGTIFRATTSGQLTTLFNFTGSGAGSQPYFGLVVDSAGNFYGVTGNGGTKRQGSVFQVTSAGKVSLVYSFCQQTKCTDGANPQGGVVVGTDSNLYGATYTGGTHSNVYCDDQGVSIPCGTVFKLTPAGELTTLYDFCALANCADGANPNGVIQGTDGNFYGTTSNGGAYDVGTVFKLTPAGKLTVLHSFAGSPTDGTNPFANVCEGSDGNFYGTTASGGQGTYGTIFKVTSGGTYTLLHSFEGSDGQGPFDSLIQGTDGKFYGTTYGGGAYSYGVIFNITASGRLTMLHNFDNADGANPYSGLMQDTNGDFYGMTQAGGADSDGVIYSLSMGLGEFIESLPTSGPVGSSVEILGTDLNGATSVTFNGAAAAFTVVSGSEIKTTVPTSATTGKIKVTVDDKTLTSNLVFRVR